MNRSCTSPLFIINQIGTAGRIPVNTKVPTMAIIRQRNDSNKKTSMFINRHIAYVGINNGWNTRDIVLWIDFMSGLGIMVQLTSKRVLLTYYSLIMNYELSIMHCSIFLSSFSLPGYSVVHGIWQRYVVQLYSPLYEVHPTMLHQLRACVYPRFQYTGSI